MIISYELKYMFVHVPKAAGTSIRNLLSINPLFKPDVLASWDGIKDSDYERFPKLTKELKSHSPTTTGIEFLKTKGHNPDEYFKFGFIRNPWDKIVSLYFYSKNVLAKQFEGKEKTQGLNSIIKNSQKSFYDFVLDEYKEESGSLSQDEKIIFNKNNLMLDFCGKFENIEEDMTKIVHEIFPYFKENPNFDCRWRLLKNNKTQHSHYKDYYNKETKKIISQKFSRIIELGKYKF